MPTYRVTDPETGVTLKLTGDSPPTESELVDIFSSYAPSAPVVSAPAEKSFFGSVAEAAGKRWENVKQHIADPATYQQTWGGYVARPIARIAGEAGNFLGDVAGEALASTYRAVVPESTQKDIAAGVRGFIQQPAVKSAIEGATGFYEGFKEQYPETAKDVNALFGVAQLVPAVKGAVPAVKATGMGIAKGAGKVGEFIRPKPNAEEALGQILQGKTTDLAKGKKALASIDTTGIKTYAELGQKIDEAIPFYAKQVDDVLASDPKVYTMNEMATSIPTSDGKIVKTNFVQDAIDHLEELYTKTNALGKAAQLEELASKAATQGLTKVEINQLARQYGSELKAFSAIGTPPTSISKQAYENVRAGLKEVARRGLGPEAKELDATLSSLFNTQRLIDKNIEAANRLSQKLDPRSLMDKLGGTVVDAIDIATGGFIKGAARKLFPRGVGLKSMNSLDLENRLERNLKILTDAEKKVATGNIPGRMLQSVRNNYTGG